MKKFIPVMILMIGLFVTMSQGNQVKASIPSHRKFFVVDNPNKAPAAMTQEEGGVAPTETTTGTPVPAVGEIVEPVKGGNFFLDNWGALLLGLLGFFDLVARLTPSEKDNSIVNFLMTLFNAIVPNIKKGGGSFRLLSK